jgi:hypothetical protein
MNRRDIPLYTAEEAGARYLELRRQREGLGVDRYGEAGMRMGQSVCSQMTPSTNGFEILRGARVPQYVDGVSGVELSQLTANEYDRLTPVGVGNGGCYGLQARDNAERILVAIRDGVPVKTKHINGRSGTVLNPRQELCDYMLDTGVNRSEAVEHFLTNNEPLWYV